MLRYAFVVLLTLACGCAFAQPNPPVRWQHYYEQGDPGITVTMTNVSNGDFAIAQGDRVTRIDSDGTVLWSQQFSIGQYGDSSACIEAVGEDGFIVCGGALTDTTQFYGWFYSAPFLLRLSASGDVRWSRVYGPDGSHATASAVQPTSDGGFLMAVGSSESPYDSAGVWKLDNNGNVIWQRRYAVSFAPRFRPTPDGGFIVLGSIAASQYLVKLDASGDSVAAIAIPNPSGNSICRDALALDDGYAVYSYRTDSSTATMIRMDLTGEAMWIRQFRLAVILDYFLPDEATLIPRADGGFVLTCDTLVMPHGDHIHLIRTDAMGNVRWTRDYVDSTSGSTWAAFGLPTNDNGYIIAGIGEVNWPFVVRTGPDLTPDAIIKPDILPQSFSLSAFPNPFNPNATISFRLPYAQRVTLTLHNVLGRQVQLLTDQIYQGGEHSLVLDGRVLPSGIYFARLQAGSYSQTQKLVLLK
jgi:outer membrane protein assembly factor BamB